MLDVMSGFNRYMVECELIRHEFLVRRDKGFNRYMVECEFAYDERNIINRTGFNRYMVECEFRKVYNKTSSVPVLIDTWWNVN